MCFRVSAAREALPSCSPAGSQTADGTPQCREDEPWSAVWPLTWGVPWIYYTSQPPTFTVTK